MKVLQLISYLMLKENTFTLRTGTGISALIISVQHCTEVLITATVKKEKGHIFRYEEVNCLYLQIR